MTTVIDDRAEGADDARVALEFTHRVRVGDDEIEGVESWSVSVQVTGSDDRAVRVGSAHAIIVRLDCPDPWYELDNMEADLGHMAFALWGSDGQLREPVRKLVEWWGGEVLIMRSVHIEEAWRGRGLGQIVAAELIRVLGRGCSLVATQAAPLGAHVREMTADQHAAAVEKLASLWAGVGFRRVRIDEPDLRGTFLVADPARDGRR